MRSTFLICCLALTVTALCQTQFPPDVAPFVSVNAPVIVLNHVRVIDGTGAAPREDQTLIISHGAIQSIGPASSAQPPSDAKILDRTGYSVIPGIVGMHNHLYYTASADPQFAQGRIEEPGFLVA